MATTKIQAAKNKDGTVRYNITVPMEWIRVYGWGKGTELQWVIGNEKKSLLIREMPKEIQI